MSRSGYGDEWDEGNWPMICYRGRVASATRGKRGQKLLRDLLAALDAMTVKELVAYSFTTESGEFCTLGVVCHARGIDIAPLQAAVIHDESEGDGLTVDRAAAALDIAKPLAAEIMFMNDEAAIYNETPEQRWTRMRAWVAEQIKP